MRSKPWKDLSLLALLLVVQSLNYGDVKSRQKHGQHPHRQAQPVSPFNSPPGPGAWTPGSTSIPLGPPAPGSLPAGQIPSTFPNPGSTSTPLGPPAPGSQPAGQIPSTLPNGGASANPTPLSPAPIPSATQGPLSAPTNLTSTQPSGAQSNTSSGTTCTTIRVRKEWRKFSRQEQINYINAVKCLANSPSKLLPGGTYRRYDDFENIHSRMRNRIHWIASFLPWHRQFVFLYEQALQTECGYAGNMPRWDWTLDSANMTASPVWSSDPQVGFGGNGRDFSDDSDGLDAGIVQDGAFANWPLYYPDEHLLQRNYNLPSEYRVRGKSWGSQFFEPRAVATVQSQKNYAKFAVALEGTDPAYNGPSNPGPHSIIHIIIGGDISPTAYAANEPLFYLHHTNVDFHWWTWQNAQRSTRLNAYGGPRTRLSGKDDARLSDRLQFLGLSDDLTVSQTMDTYSYPYCYRYE